MTPEMEKIAKEAIFHTLYATMQLLDGFHTNDIDSEHTVYQWRRKYVRANKKGVCPTLTANMGRGGHNVPIIKNCVGIRKLTPRECFLLQGFPEDFKLPETFFPNLDGVQSNFKRKFSAIFMEPQ